MLIRIAFVLAYIFYSWQDSLTAVEISNAQLKALGLAMPGSLNVVTALFTSSLIGVGLMFLVPLLARLFLNMSRFYSVPRAEYGLLVHVFFTLYYVVCGALRLINLFTPILLVWGSVLFPVVTSLGCVIWFYIVTSRLYFNDVIKPFYFRNMAIVYLVCAFVFGVIL